jgi:hypothetical protein
MKTYLWIDTERTETENEFIAANADSLEQAREMASKLITAKYKEMMANRGPDNFLLEYDVKGLAQGLIMIKDTKPAILEPNSVKYFKHKNM